MTCQCEIPQRPQRNKKSGSKAWNVVAGTLVLLIPKCAMCWTAYLSLLGWAGVSALAYRSWFVPVAILFFCFTLGRLLWRAFISRQFLAFLLALLAAGLITWEKIAGAEPAITIVAMILMISSWFADRRSKPFAISERFTRQPGV